MLRSLPLDMNVWDRFFNPWDINLFEYWFCLNLLAEREMFTSSDTFSGEMFSSFQKSYRWGAADWVELYIYN